MKSLVKSFLGDERSSLMGRGWSCAKESKEDYGISLNCYENINFASLDVWNQKNILRHLSNSDSGS